MLPPPHGKAQSESSIRRRGGVGLRPLSVHQGKCAWKGGVGFWEGGLFPALADWGPCVGSVGRRAVALDSGGVECWVWCGRCSCFLLWRSSNLQQSSADAGLMDPTCLSQPEVCSMIQLHALKPVRSWWYDRIDEELQQSQHTDRPHHFIHQQTNSQRSMIGAINKQQHTHSVHPHFPPPTLPSCLQLL